jgi:hypothetical protein
MLLATCLCCLLVGCRRSGDPPGSTQVASVPQGDDVLVIIDLSASLSLQERERIPGLVSGLLQQMQHQAPKATFAVYLLESNMGNRVPLLEDQIPDLDSPFPDVRNKARGTVRSWAPHLQATVDEILAWPPKQQNQVLTSCYLASAVFANKYFSGRTNVAHRHVVWIGDLIEDCPETLDMQYYRYRLPSPSAIQALQGLQLKLPALQGVDLKAVMIPRTLTDPASQVPASRIVAYWEALPQHIGLPPNGITVGTSNQLGIAEVSLQ